MSDHLSGPRAIAGPYFDICDVYAFPSPEQPGWLVLVMNVFPPASPSDFFSDAIICRFRLRPVTIAPQAGSGGTGVLFAVGGEETEQVFDVTFEVPRKPSFGAAPVQAGRCTPPVGEAATCRVHDETGGHAAGLRVFAGARLEPFFLDALATLETFKTGRLAFREVGNSVRYDANVLSVVVEVECATLLAAGGGPLFAVVGETVTDGKLPIRLERVGRPEVKNVIMSAKNFDTVNRDLEIRDLYNMEDVFHMGKDYLGAYRARLNANLAFFDRLDGKADWPLDAQGAHPLTEVLLADFLVVDISKPFAEDSYFEIEQATLQGRTHATCGGRSLNDDVMDTLFTVLVNAGNGPRISDGLDQAMVPASMTFPYLAPAHPLKTAAKKGATP